MHELSVALELVDLAVAEARRLGDVRVVALRLRLGPLAGVVEDALLFAFEVAASGTEIEGARLDIEKEALTAWCASCADVRVLDSMQYRRCPICDQPTPDVMTGHTFELTALEVVDNAPSDR